MFNGSVPKPVPGNEGIPYAETGVLEAYQRAIANAEDYIYIEDQYFTCKEVVTALIQRMNKCENLQLIIVLNMKTDHPDYRKKQIDFIKQLRSEITNNQRIKVFTLWSCDETKLKFEIMPITIHSKVAIIDDKWATVGTANLDGASMNQIDTISTGDVDGNYLEFLPLWLKIILFPFSGILIPLVELTIAISGHFVYRRPSQHANPQADNQPSRFVDLNVVIYNDIAGQAKTDFVSDFRKELWAEHLGLSQKDIPLSRPGNPLDPTDGWVKFWQDRANAKLADIKVRKKNPAKILEWQPQTEAKKYLTALGLRPSDLCIRDKADEFDIEKSEWKFVDLDDRCAD